MPKPQSRRFISDAITTVLASAGSRLVTIAALAAITRLYAPGDYGIWVVLFAFSGFFQPLTTLRYEIALVLAPGPPLARRIFWVILCSTILVAIMLAIAMLVMPTGWLVAASGLAPDQILWLYACPALVLLMGWQLLLQSLLLRGKRFRPINFALFAQAAVMAAICVGIGYAYKATPAVAVGGGLGGQVAGCIVLAIAARAELQRLITRWPGSTNMRSAMSYYRVYPVYSLPYSISVAFTERALQLIMATVYSVSFLGTYYVARQIMLAPAQIVSAALRNVLLAHGARHSGMAETRSEVQMVINGYICAAAPVFATAIFWIEPVTRWALGTNWPLIHEMAWWVLFPGIILMITGSIDRLFDLAGRQRLAVVLQIGSDAVMLASIVAVVSLALPGLTMVAVISVVQALYNVIWFAIALRVAGFDYGAIFRGYAMFAVWAVTVMAVQWSVQSLLPITIALPVGLGFGVVAAAGALLVFARRNGLLNGRVHSPVVADAGAAP